MRMTAASDQQLETDLQPRKSSKHKSRSPLRYRRKHQIQDIDFELDVAHCVDRCLSKPLDKLPKKKMNGEMSQACLDAIAGESEKKRHKKDKGRFKAQRCLDDLEELKNNFCNFEKMTQGKTFGDQVCELFHMDPGILEKG